MRIKREVWMFLIIFALALLMCMAFLQPHYTHDTYYIELSGYSRYAQTNFVPEGRPITGLVMILADLINIDIKVLGVISFVIAIAFLSLSVVLLYKIMTKENKNISNQVMTLLVSFLIIFNYLMIEHIYFLESSIMSLGILLSVYACKVFTNNEKYRYLKSYLLLLVAVFCYQGSIAIFPMIILTYYAIIEKALYRIKEQEELKKINNIILKEYKDIKTIVWSTNILNEFTQHYIMNNYIVVETERFAVEMILTLLKEKLMKKYTIVTERMYNENKNVFLNNENLIIVKFLNSRAPLDKNKDGILEPTLEKIMIDLYKDKLYEFVQGKELERIYTNIFDSYSINLKKLYSYAKDRVILEQYKKYLMNLNVVENV